MTAPRVGILGGGQLAQMMAQAGAPLGMTFRFLDPAGDVCAREFGEHVQAAYEDVEALEEFARGLDVITYEFENVPVESARWLGERVPVFPPPEALRTAQDRLFEKTFFVQQGVASPLFASFFFRDEFDEALRGIGLPAVLKTRRFGYDGKGQRVVRTPEEAERAWRDLHGLPLFLEAFVPFRRELSLVLVRSRTGEMAFYPLVENHHRGGILRVTVAPAAGVPAALQQQAEAHGRRVAERLGYVGVLAIEFFETQEGTLLVNEMAPRVHNSGHWSQDGGVTSQFENHLRAVLGLPLGPTTPRTPTAMLNLVGAVPDAAASLAAPDVVLHLYGKAPRPGRKLGHVNVTAPDGAVLRRRVEHLVQAYGDPHLLDAFSAARF